MLSFQFPTAALVFAMLKGLTISAGTSECRVRGNCVSDRSESFYNQLQDELAGLDNLNKIHIERPDPAYYHSFEVITAPTSPGVCPYAYVFPQHMSAPNSEGIEHDVKFSIQMLGNATVGLSSVCEKDCFPAKTCSGHRSGPKSVVTLGVFAVLGLLCVTRPLKFSTYLVVVILAVVMMSSSSFFANSSQSTNVVPDGGCACTPPYTYEEIGNQGKQKQPFQFVLYHSPNVNVNVIENSECVPFLLINSTCKTNCVHSILETRMRVRRVFRRTIQPTTCLQWLLGHRLQWWCLSVQNYMQ